MMYALRACIIYTRDCIFLVTMFEFTMCSDTSILASCKSMVKKYFISYQNLIFIVFTLYKIVLYSNKNNNV